MPFLAFNLNNGNEFIFDLEDARLSLGRNSRNEIVIDSVQISSFHAELLRRPDGLYEVIDLKSSNGTFVNGKRVERAVLRQGDKVRFGGLEAKFRDTREPEVSAGKGSGKTIEEKKREAEQSGAPSMKTEAVQLTERPAAIRSGGNKASQAPSTATSAVPVLRDSKVPFPRPGTSSSSRFSSPHIQSLNRGEDYTASDPKNTPAAQQQSVAPLQTAMPPPAGLQNAPLMLDAPQQGGMFSMPPPASLSASPPPPPAEAQRSDPGRPARGRSGVPEGGTETPKAPELAASMKSVGGRQAPSTVTSAVPVLKTTRAVRVGPGALPANFAPPKLQSLDRSEDAAASPPQAEAQRVSEPAARPKSGGGRHAPSLETSAVPTLKATRSVRVGFGAGAIPSAFSSPPVQAIAPAAPVPAPVQEAPKPPGPARTEEASTGGMRNQPLVLDAPQSFLTPPLPPGSLSNGTAEDEAQRGGSEELIRAKMQHAEVKRELAQAQADLNAVQAQIAEHKAAEMRTRDRAGRESGEAEEYLSKLGRDIREAEERLAAMTRDVSSRESNASALAAAASTRVDELNRSVGTMQARQKDLEENIAGLFTERTTREKDLEEVNARLASAREEVEAARKFQQALADQTREAEARLREAATRADQSHEARGMTEDRVKALESELAAAQERLQVVRTEAEQAAKALEDRRAAAEAGIAQREEQLRALDMRVAEHEAKRNAAETRLVELAGTDNRLASASEALKLIQEQQTATEVALARLRTQQEQERAEMAQTAEKLASLIVQQNRAASEAETAQKDLADYNERLAIAKGAVTEAQAEAERRQFELDKAFAEKEAALARAAAEREQYIREAEAKAQSLDATLVGMTGRINELRELEKVLVETRPRLEAVEVRRNEAEASLTSLSAQVHERTRELSEVAARVGAQEGALNEMAAREQEMQANLQSLRKESETERARFEELRATSADGEKALGARRAELERAVADMESSARSFEERMEQLRRKEEEVMRKLGDLSSTDTKLQDAAKALQVVEEQRGRIEEQLATLGVQREEREQEISASAEKGAAQHLLVLTLSRQRSSLEENVTELTAAAERARAHLAETEAKKSETEARLNTRTAEAEKTLADLEQKAASEKKAFEEFKARREEIDKQLANLKDTESKIASARDMLTATQKGQVDAEAKLKQILEQVTTEQKHHAELTAKSAELGKSVQAHKEQQSFLQENITRLSHESTAQGTLRTEHIAAAKEAARQLALKQTELAGVEDQLAIASRKRLELETQLAELGDIDRKVAESREGFLALERQIAEHREKITGAAQEKIQVEQALATVKLEMEGQRTQLDSLRQQQEQAKREIDVAKQLAETEAVRAAGIREEIAQMGSVFAARQTEVAATEKKLEAVMAKLAPAEKRFADLQDLEGRVREAQNALKAVEKLRSTEERNLADLEKEREKLRRDIAGLTAQEKADRTRADEQSRRAKTEEARVAEAGKQLERLSGTLQQVEAKRIEAERRVQAAQEEERAVRAGIPSVTAEMSKVRDELQALLSERSGEEAKLKRLVDESADAAKRLEAVMAKCASLEQGRVALEQAMATSRTQQEEVAVRLATMKAEDEELQKSTSAARARHQEQEAGFAARLGEMEKALGHLRQEEERLANALHTTRAQLQEEEAAGEILRQKLLAAETHYSGLVRSGDKILSINEALELADERRREMNRNLSGMAEQELALQVRLTALDENIKRDTRREEELRREREQAEEENRRAIERLRGDFEGMKQMFGDQLKREETALASRMKERIADMQQKHDILSRGLAAAADEQTVILFANDLIKRLDLIDILIQRYTGSGQDGVEQQLRTLRASFEDILSQHGIAEFRVDSGTEVDVALRQRIAVVENVTGEQRPRVVESYRPGFVYSPDGSREMILRKVEVKTSSE